MVIISMYANYSHQLEMVSACIEMVWQRDISLLSNYIIGY